MSILIGCAGWNLRKEFAAEFPVIGTHLARYAERLNGVEINSSFHRSHRTVTYRRWADSTPNGFRFAVKVPKQVTHVSRLIDVEPQIEEFLSEASGLGEKLGTILIQLPPSLDFDRRTVQQVFRAFRIRISTPIVCEPRHRKWFGAAATSLMKEYGIGRVAADPSILPEAAVPGGCKRTCYFRWHGSPRMYYSSYDDQALGRLADQLVASAGEAEGVWCIFDNTAVGAALSNALTLRQMVSCALSER